MSVQQFPEAIPGDDRPRSEVVANRPSAAAVWAVAVTCIVAFAIGGLGVVYKSDGYFWVLWLGCGLFVLAVLAGWAVGIMEYTEEQEEAGLAQSEGKLDPQTNTGS